MFSEINRREKAIAISERKMHLGAFFCLKSRGRPRAIATTTPIFQNADPGDMQEAVDVK